MISLSMRKVLVLFVTLLLLSTIQVFADELPPQPPESGSLDIVNVSNGAIFRQGWNFFNLGFDGCSAEALLNELQANGGSALKLTNIFVRGFNSWQPYSFVNPDSSKKSIGGGDLVSFYSTINFSMQLDSSACKNQDFQRQQEIEKVRQGSVAQSQTSLVDKIHDLPLDLWNKLMNLLNNNNLQNPDKQVLDTLSVAGKTTVNNLGVTGNISQGYLSVNGLDSDLSAATINTINNDLYFQNLGVGGVNFLNGKVLIDKNGNLTVQKLNVSSNSLGKGTLPAGKTSLIINTGSVTTSSAVFVTLEDTNDTPLAVTNKVTGKSFTVELSKPAVKDLKFDWWVVN